MTPQNLKFKRAAFLDVHSPLYLRSKKSKFCGGDIGEMYEIVDLAHDAGFKGIQLTPIQDTSYNSCPYMGESIFSYNPIHLSIELAGLERYTARVDSELRQRITFHENKETVDYRDLYTFKKNVLRIAFDNSMAEKNIDLNSFDENVLAYAVFCALKDNFQTSNWVKWPEKYRKAQLDKIIGEDLDLHTEIKFYLFIHQIMGNQWRELADYADKKGVAIVMDKPIYPSHQSSEVWFHQDLFYLHRDGSLKYVSGCCSPNDPFGEQRWGHAVYRFDEKPDEVVDYILESVKFLSWVSKVVRLDHTLALIWKYYIIDDAKQEGRHLPALKDKILSQLTEQLPDVFFIAEDMGIVDEELIDKPLAKYGIPGMRTIQGSNNPRFYELSGYPELSIAFTSDHDTLALATWWRKVADIRREHYYHQKPELLEMDFEQQVWALIRMVFESKSLIASITLRDLIGDPRRFNLPGETNDTNWRLRMPKKMEEVDFSQIKQIIHNTNRVK